MLAIACMLIANSCSQDEFLEETLEGDFVEATFTIATSDGIGTRADNDIIGKGLMADIVECAVFDAAGKEMTELRKTESIDLSSTPRTATYSVRLAKGQNYRIAFFAYNSVTKAYDVTNMKYIIVKGDQVSNVEGRDAFTGYYDVETGKTLNAINETVILKRPFAQLNLGIDDEEYQAAAKAGIVVKESKIVVSNVYDRFSAYDNSVATGAVAGTMTFDLNEIPVEKLYVKINDENKEFNYLALNYLLVGDLDSEKTLTDVEFIWKTEDGKTNSPTTTFLNIPVQRNYRTNIIGKLLTSPANFNIQIDAAFTDEHNEENPDYVIHKVFNAQDLQAAIDAVQAGETKTIYLGNHITGDVIDYQKNDRHITIDGIGGYKYNGTIKIHNGSSNCSGSITIKNIAFETDKVYYYDNGEPYFNFIMPNDFGVEDGITRRYSQNVTVHNCSFTTTNTEYINYGVGVQAKSCTNLNIVGCIATGMHSLLQAQSCGENVAVKGCTINGKNGVAFKQVKSATVEGTTITADAYGIRFDGNIDNYGIIVKDNNITASQPFIVRKMTGKNNTIALEGTNTLTVSPASASTEDPAYQIIITNGSDDEAYVKPTGTYTLTGADGYICFPSPFKVATWDEFTAALAAGEDWIILTANISNDKSYSLFNNVILDLDGKTLEISGATNRLDIGSKNDGSKPKPTVTIKNGNLYCKVYAQTGNVTLTDIKFGGTIAYTGDAQGVITVGNANLLASNCDMSNVTASAPDKRPRALSTEGLSSGYLKLIDCNFPSASDGTGMFVKTKMLRTYINPLSGNAQLEISNCKFGVAANIDLAATYVWNNMNLTGCSGGFTFTVTRNINSLTDEETNIMKAIKKNNGGTIKAYYNGTLVTY